MIFLLQKFLIKDTHYMHNNYKEWLDKANDDYLNAKSILNHKDGAPSGVCFLSQQLAEKCLKALLTDS